LANHEPAAPPPHSWAARVDADVAIWHIRLAPDATWTVPAATGEGTQRVLYAFDGSTVSVGEGGPLSARTGAHVRAGVDLSLRAGVGGIDCLLLQGRPIGEPIARYGPFVMNTDDEIQVAFADYQASRFGGWPWSSPAPDHGPDKGRFAIHADGRREDVDH
jgi:quercetin 2,3-dioxygenase